MVNADLRSHDRCALTWDTRRRHLVSKRLGGIYLSVLEELRALEDRLRMRVKELQPLIDEYNELQRVAERLGIDLEAAPAQNPQAARASRATQGRKPAKQNATTAAPSGRKRKGGTHATGRERRELVLGLVTSRPGITVPIMSAETGIDAPSLYRVVRRLTADGVIKKEGRSLQPA
jgi:hypothetical protein